MPKEVDIHVEKPAAKSSSELLVHGNMQKEIDIHDRTGRNAYVHAVISRNQQLAMPGLPCPKTLQIGIIAVMEIKAI